MEKLLSFIPTQAQAQVQEVLQGAHVNIKITKKRQTKHGDFRKLPNGNAVITLNATSNPYRFLITLLHELAHFKVSQKQFFRSKPHGIEWKKAYRETLLPFLNPIIFPEPLCSLLAHHMKNPKASTDRDFKLVMALRAYDPETEHTPIFELKEGQEFQLENGRAFVKLKKRRTRFECRELHSGKIYLFSPHAEVVPV
ncbi:MAG TPA: sprT domain-containing protein [Flavobacteriaceae bacterium]|jgi:SprT protein|nr:sprT domain-containing protein [Flavobacteriaceae bacterium]